MTLTLPSQNGSPDFVMERRNGNAAIESKGTAMKSGDIIVTQNDWVAQPELVSTNESQIDHEQELLNGSNPSTGTTNGLQVNRNELALKPTNGIAKSNDVSKVNGIKNTNTKGSAYANGSGNGVAKTDVLESMSLEDGKVYNQKLMPIARGETLPNRNVPVEYMFYDLWESMRSHDRELANEVLEPTFVFMRAQTDKVRKEITEIGQYLEYREKDVGKALLSALMRFAMDLHLSANELQEMKAVEQNCAKHISIVNDIYSWEKELKQSQNTTEEGSYLCTGVQVLSISTGLDIAAAKACLWTMVREWEFKHEMLCSEPFVSRHISMESMLYLKGLEFQMSGNELWSRTTPRYLVVD